MEFCRHFSEQRGRGEEEGDSVSGPGSSIVTESGSKLLSEQLRGERAGVWHECILYRNIKDFVWRIRFLKIGASDSEALKGQLLS